MKHLFLGFLLIFSTAVFADENADVAQWTRKTLLNTFSLDFTYQSSDADKHSIGFTRNAWNGLSSFLGGYVQVIRDQKLTIHPEFTAEPTVVDSGMVDGIKYWRVNEEILFPELQLKVAFSTLVLATTPTPNGSYIIQSIDMLKQGNS